MVLMLLSFVVFYWHILLSVVAVCALPSSIFVINICLFLLRFIVTAATVVSAPWLMLSLWLVLSRVVGHRGPLSCHFSTFSSSSYEVVVCLMQFPVSVFLCACCWCCYLVISATASVLKSSTDSNAVSSSRIGQTWQLTSALSSSPR